MEIGLCLLGIAVMGWALAALAVVPEVGIGGLPRPTRPRRSVRGGGVRRSGHPGGSAGSAGSGVSAGSVPAHGSREVTILDVERLLRGQLPPATTARVIAVAVSRGMAARTLWRWVDRFGGDRLVMAVDAGVAEKRMRRHLDDGTDPDWAALAIFAELSAHLRPGTMPLAEVLEPDAAPVAEEGVDLADWATEVAPDPTLDVTPDAVPGVSAADGAAAVDEVDEDLGRFGPLPPRDAGGPPAARPAPPPRDGHPRPDDGWPRVA